jgi:hypothetical protein
MRTCLLKVGNNINIRIRKIPTYKINSTGLIFTSLFQELPYMNCRILLRCWRLGRWRPGNCPKICSNGRGVDYLREAVAQLLYEPTNSAEGQLGKVAIQDLKRLRYTIQRAEIMMAENGSDLRGLSSTAKSGISKKRGGRKRKI